MPIKQTLEKILAEVRDRMKMINHDNDCEQCHIPDRYLEEKVTFYNLKWVESLLLAEIEKCHE